MVSPTNVRKQVNSNSYYFTTIPGGRPGGRVAGGIENKANSVKFQFKLPVGTELGNFLDQINFCPFLPTLDSLSPLAYAICLHYHKLPSSAAPDQLKNGALLYQHAGRGACQINLTKSKYIV